MTPVPQRCIGFVGTGIMGAPMARRLAEAGFVVRAWNRSSAKAEVLRAAGIEVVATPAEAAAGTRVVVCMLSSGPVCDAVLGEAGGVVAAMAPGAVLVVMSSIPPATARSQAEEAGRRGIAYVDAPVSGESGARSQARSPSWPAAKRRWSTASRRSSRRSAGSRGSDRSARDR